MTAFFVPGAPVGEPADRAYEDLRDRAELDTGRPPRLRRIYMLSCRRGGAACETASASTTSRRDRARHLRRRDRYAIYVTGGHEIVTKRQTYAVVEFDA